MVVILRNRIKITNKDFQRMQRKSNTMRKIFNPDNKRLQRYLPKTDSISQIIYTTLLSNGYMQGRYLGSIVLLKSLSGCKRQYWHTDYNSNECSHLKIKPLGVILALQNDTLFDEFPDTIHKLNQGDLLIFEGDEIHAGSSYNAENIRVHAFIDVNEIKRKRNKTYKI